MVTVISFGLILVNTKFQIHNPCPHSPGSHRNNFFIHRYIKVGFKYSILNEILHF